MKHLTVKELADRWNCSGSTVRRMLVARSIHGFRTSGGGPKGSWRVSLAEVERYESEGARAVPSRTISTPTRLPRPILSPPPLPDIRKIDEAFGL